MRTGLEARRNSAEKVNTKKKRERRKRRANPGIAIGRMNNMNGFPRQPENRRNSEWPCRVREEDPGSLV